MASTGRRALRAGNRAAWPRASVSTQYWLYGARVQNTPARSRTVRPTPPFAQFGWQDWKYVAIQGGKPLLFDLAGDPGERRNLAAGKEARPVGREIGAE